MSIYGTLRSAAPGIVSTFTNENAIDHQRATKTPNGSGGNTTVWASVGTLSGAVVPLSGNEQFIQDGLKEVVTHAVYVSYADGAGVLVSDRVVFRGRVFDIRWSQNIGEADAAIRLLCEEGAKA